MATAHSVCVDVAPTTDVDADRVDVERTVDADCEAAAVRGADRSLVALGAATATATGIFVTGEAATIKGFVAEAGRAGVTDDTTLAAVTRAPTREAVTRPVRKAPDSCPATPAATAVLATMAIRTERRRHLGDEGTP